MRLEQIFFKKPPYPPLIWNLGASASIPVDVPLASVFLLLFVIAAAFHMTISHLNRFQGYHFFPSTLVVSFCISRVVTMALRIVTAFYPVNVSLALSSTIFVNAGLFLLYIMNLVFAQRIIRAQHPHFGWSKPFNYFIWSLFALIFVTLLMAVGATLHMFYTLDNDRRIIDRDILLFSISVFGLVSILPIIMLTASLLIPRKFPVDKFGYGSLRTKIIMVLTSSFLLTFGCWYRAGTGYINPVSRLYKMPPYFHKAAFYLVMFFCELIVIYMYAIMRFDRRFHIPDGASGPGSYAATRKAAAEQLPSHFMRLKGGDTASLTSTDIIPSPEDTIPFSPVPSNLYKQKTASEI